MRHPRRSDARPESRIRIPVIHRCHDHPTRVLRTIRRRKPRCEEANTSRKKKSGRGLAAVAGGGKTSSGHCIFPTRRRTSPGGTNGTLVQRLLPFLPTVPFVLGRFALRSRRSLAFGLRVATITGILFLSGRRLSVSGAVLRPRGLLRWRRPSLRSGLSVMLPVLRTIRNRRARGSLRPRRGSRSGYGMPVRTRTRGNGRALRRRGPFGTGRHGGTGMDGMRRTVMHSGAEIRPRMGIDGRMDPMRIATHVIVVPVPVLMAETVQDQPETGRTAADAQRDRNAHPVAVAAPIVTVHHVLELMTAPPGELQSEQQIARRISFPDIIAQIRPRHAVFAGHFDDETVGVGGRIIVDHEAETVTSSRPSPKYSS